MGVAAFDQFAAQEFGDFVSVLFVHWTKGSGMALVIAPVQRVEFAGLLRGGIRSVFFFFERLDLLLERIEGLLGGFSKELVGGGLAAEAVD